MNINFYRLNKTNSYLIFDINEKPNEINNFLNTCATIIKDVDIFHLKNSALNTKELLEIVKTLKLICAEFNVIFILEDRCDIVFTADIDGVFLNKNSFSYNDAKELLGENKIIGCEAHNNNADYFVLSDTDTPKDTKIYYSKDKTKLSPLNNMVYLHRTYL